MKRFALLICAAACGGPQRPPPAAERYVLTGTRVYLTPDQPPIDHAWVVVNTGTIESFGSGEPPIGVRRNAACSDGVIAAGFQNSHVHFTDPAFSRAADRPRDELEKPLIAMTSRFGFTTVVDTASDLLNTIALRSRIEHGELRGPAILTVGYPLYPDHGIPIYLRDLPPEILAQLPQPATADEARAIVRTNFAHGANATKLFIATPQGHGEIKRMAIEIAVAAVDETRKAGGLVVVHPTDADGVTAAVQAGVDIIAHTTIDGATTEWSDQLIHDMVAKHISLVPTLKLWGYELAKQHVAVEKRDAIVAPAEHQLAAFIHAGGQVLFGTDVGYMTDLDPTDEYVLMAHAGLTPMQILASLTTAPAARWNAGDHRGRIAPGLSADLVVLDGDPATDVRRFAAVRCTIRAGREIFVR
jgi:imidazolonepropionase-like amidohydrolase